MKTSAGGKKTIIRFRTPPAVDLKRICRQLSTWSPEQLLAFAQEPAVGALLACYGARFDVPMRTEEDEESADAQPGISFICCVKRLTGVTAEHATRKMSQGLLLLALAKQQVERETAEPPPSHDLDSTTQVEWLEDLRRQLAVAEKRSKSALKAYAGVGTALLRGKDDFYAMLSLEDYLVVLEGKTERKRGALRMYCRLAEFIKKYPRFLASGIPMTKLVSSIKVFEDIFLEDETEMAFWSQ